MQWNDAPECQNAICTKKFWALKSREKKESTGKENGAAAPLRNQKEKKSKSFQKGEATLSTTGK